MRRQLWTRLFPFCIAVITCVAIALATKSPVHSQDGARASGVLARVPADATAFLHVKAAELWKAEAAAGFREMLTKAGPEAISAFNRRFTPAPATLDTIAAYVLPPSEDGPPAVGVLAGFVTDFDQTTVLKTLLPKSVEKNHFGQKYSEDIKADLAIRIVNSRTLLISNCAMMPRLVAYDAKATGPLSPHFTAAGGKAIYAVVNVGAMPQELRDEIPEQFKPIANAKDVVLTGDLGKELSLKLTMRYADAGAAGAADVAIRDALKAAGSQMGQMVKDSEQKVKSPAKDKTSSLADLPEAIGDLMGLASMKSMEQLFANPPYTKQGESLVLDYRFDPSNPQTVASTIAMAAGVITPAVAKTREAAMRTKGHNNLRQLALAMHAYHDSQGMFPAHAIYTKDKKKALLSWRVSLLPYVECEDLYKQFKLDEPWDSEDNKKLIAKMPSIFVDPEAPPSKESGQTHYQVFLGGGAGFRIDAKGTKMFDIQDGTSNTIMISVAENPVTWTKPDDMPYAPNKPLPKLGHEGKPVAVAFFDGTVRTLKPKMPDRVLRALITMAGGELVSDDF